MKKLILAFLVIQAFAKTPEGKEYLTDEERAKVAAQFGEDFTARFVELLGKSESSGDDNMAGEYLNLVQQLNTARAELTSLQSDRTATQTSITQMQATITTLQGAVNTLAGRSENDPPAGGRGGAGSDPQINEMDDKFLLGIKEPFMAIDEKHAYNRRAYASIMSRKGMIHTVPAATDIDYESLKTDLGEYYRVRKQNRIQSFVQSLPNLETIFPLESNYQDQAVLVNLFMGEFSQADNTIISDFENVSKGEYKLEPEILQMYDVMFAKVFRDLKTLEKTWIGYLNREGSDPIKMSFIEYILVETAKVLLNEQQTRRINGVRKNPTANVAGTAMEAANGLRKFIKNQIALFKVKPFAIGEWTASTISNYIYTATGMIPAVLRDSGNIVLYMSPAALVKYHKNRETLYGLNQDYKADLMYVAEYPQVKIIPIPGMNESQRMIWTIDGNIRLFEDQPGEMTRFKIELKDWTIKVWSNWKESVWAIMTGKKFASAAEMPDDYSTQMIFTNDVDEPADYYIPMTKNDTTPSVLNHTSLVSVANSQATVITDITDCAVGQEVRLKCGNVTNAPTIAQSAKFSLLSAAWNPDLNDILILKKRSDGKFIELARINSTSDAIVIPANDTTPDVSDGSIFVTSPNTTSPLADVKITTLDEAVYSKVYRIYGGSDTNPTVIENAGNFVLTANITLTSGVYIDLQKSEVDDKFYEIARG